MDLCTEWLGSPGELLGFLIDLRRDRELFSYIRGDFLFFGGGKVCENCLRRLRMLLFFNSASVCMCSF